MSLGVLERFCEARLRNNQFDWILTRENRPNRGCSQGREGAREKTGSPQVHLESSAQGRSDAGHLDFKIKSKGIIMAEELEEIN